MQVAAQDRQVRVEKALKKAGIEYEVEEDGRIRTRYTVTNEKGQNEERWGYVTGRTVDKWVAEGRRPEDIDTALKHDGLRSGIRAFDMAEYDAQLPMGSIGVSEVDTGMATQTNAESEREAGGRRLTSVLGKVVDGANSIAKFADDNPLLAMMGVTMAQAAATGGPIKQVVMSLGKAAIGEVFSAARGYVYDKVQSTVSEYLQDSFGVGAKVADLAGHGAAFVVDFALDDPRKILANAQNIRGIVANNAENHASHEIYKDNLRAVMEKPAVSDPTLSRLIDPLYRPNATVGSGSTAAAVRQELATGQPVGGAFHSKKAQDGILALQHWLNKNPTAKPGDRAAAENIIRDMSNSLRGQ